MDIAELLKNPNLTHEQRHTLLNMEKMKAEDLNHLIYGTTLPKVEERDCHVLSPSDWKNVEET